MNTIRITELSKKWYRRRTKFNVSFSFSDKVVKGLRFYELVWLLKNLVEDEDVMIWDKEDGGMSFRGSHWKKVMKGVEERV
jgi:intergrase/recombinase